MIQASTIPKVHEVFLKLYQVEYNSQNLKKSVGVALHEHQPELPAYLDLLNQAGEAVHIAYFRNHVSPREIEEVLRESSFPVLLFLNGQGAETEPVIFHRSKGQYKLYHIGATEAVKETLSDLSELLPRLVTQPVLTAGAGQEFVLMVTCFPNTSLYSATFGEEHAPANAAKEGGHKPLKRLARLLLSEKREIIYIYVYAVIAGIISLSLPLGIQSIIGFVSSGQVSTSVVVLIVFIILGVLISGMLQVMQLWLVELIKQRIFAKTAFEFAFRIPKLQVESMLKYYPPELVNRFFDVVTLQKGLATILIDFSRASLQVLFGLILLSLYHPYFIIFGLFLIAILGLILRLTGPGGISTSLQESGYKYKLVNWLEEMARSLNTFKLAGQANLPLERTDYFTSNYLHARKHHFRILMTQYISFVGFKTVITGGLLILGCVLVLSREINIGQFVASEIIIILVLNASEKLIIKLDSVYDTLTSLEKIGKVTDLPLDSPGGIRLNALAPTQGMSLEIKQLSYRYPNTSHNVLNGVNLSLKPGEKVCLAGYNRSGKTTLVHLVLGLFNRYEGAVVYNGLSLRDLNKHSLLSSIGDNVAHEELFEGSLLENITLGRSQVSLELVTDALEVVGLSNFVQELPNGLNTHLVGGNLWLPASITRQIVLARSIAHRPSLLILDDFLRGISPGEKTLVLNRLLAALPHCTLLLISNDPAIMERTDRLLLMREGRIIHSAPFGQIKDLPEVQELVQTPA